MACLDNTQAYNAFVFVIIKDNTLKYMLHLDLFHLCLLSSKPLIALAQHFLFLYFFHGVVQPCSAVVGYIDYS